MAISKETIFYDTAKNCFAKFKSKDLNLDEGEFSELSFLEFVKEDLPRILRNREELLGYDHRTILSLALS